MKSIKEIYVAYRESAGVSTDTRTIGEGSMFVALKGERFDANVMVGEALARGAKYVVTSNKDYEGEGRAFVVEDTLTALQRLAAYHRDQLDIPVVGITGSNGKTTTKELVTAVLGAKYNVVATKGNLNNHIGVPLTLLSIGSDAEVAVVEMGASHPGEIAELAAIAKPTMGLVTNVGIAHIEGFGSFEGVKNTKAALYKQIMATGGVAIYDSENEDIVDMIGEYENIVPYVAAKVIESEGETMEMEWADASEAHYVKTQLCGDYNVKNAQAAITVGRLLGVDADKIDDAIEGYVPTNGRSQVLETGRNHLIVDAYNANPSSMAAALDNFERRRGEHKCVILGAMRELGVEEVPQHLRVMERLAGMGLDEVILIGEEYGKHREKYPAFKYFDATVDSGETVKGLTGKYILLKGSNSNKLSQLTEYL